MKKFARLLSIGLLSMAMISPVGVDAQNRGASRHQGASPTRPMSRPSNPGNRPGANTPGQNRPGQNRPGNPGPGQNRPGQNRPGNPGPGHGPGHGPGYNPAPGPGYGHGHGPGHHGHGPGWMAPPPPRPGRPVFRPWGRPLPPPPSWRYYGGGPSFGTILGVAFGTTLAATVDALLYQGYTVDGYNNGVVYLRNVNEMGYMWPDATMYYTSAGGLRGSEFYYATTYADPSRYNMVYNTLIGRYGFPTARNGYQCVWYGAGGLYISLNYGLGATDYGTNAFVTTLTFGN